MNELALFASAYLTVFALGFQQQNVIHRNFLAAAFTSLVIGTCQIYLWRTLPGAGWSDVLATLAGGPAGIVSAMWAHPVIIKRRASSDA